MRNQSTASSSRSPEQRAQQRAQGRPRKSSSGHGEDGPRLGPGKAEEPCKNCLYGNRSCDRGEQHSLMEPLAPVLPGLLRAKAETAVLPTCMMCRQTQSKDTYNTEPLLETLRDRHAKWTDLSTQSGNQGPQFEVPLSAYSNPSIGQSQFPLASRGSGSSPLRSTLVPPDTSFNPERPYVSPQFGAIGGMQPEMFRGGGISGPSQLPLHTIPNQSAPNARPMTSAYEGMVTEPTPWTAYSSAPGASGQAQSAHQTQYLQNPYQPQQQQYFPTFQLRAAQTGVFAGKSEGGDTSSARLGPISPSVTQMSEVDLLMAMSRSTLMSGYYTRPVDPPEWMRILFPTQSDLECFHHCVLYSMSIFVVREERNPWIEHVVPLMLFPTGHAPLSTEAMRLATLATGATHLAYLDARGGSTASGTPSRDGERRARALRYRQNAVRLLRQAKAHDDELTSDAFLAASAILMFTDMLSANTTWKEVHRIAHEAIIRRGGCEGIIFGEARDPGAPSARKCILFQMILIDLYSSFTTGHLPKLFRGNENGNEPWFPRCIEMDDDVRFDAICGIEDSMGALGTRVLVLMSQNMNLIDKHGKPAVRRALGLPTDSTSPILTTRLNVPTNLYTSSKASSSSSSTHSPQGGPCSLPAHPTSSTAASSNHSSPPSSVESNTANQNNAAELELADFARKAATLWHDVDNWTANKPVPAAMSELRTRGGSLSVMYGSKIILRREVYGLPRDDPVTQESANQVLRLCIEVGDKVRYMDWPLIVASEVICDAARRGTVRQIVRAFEYQACYEIAVTQAVIEEMWRRIDQGVDDEGCHWRTVLTEMGCPVLIM